ncbi:MAG: NOL1/NOP2/sun family putative RNA methylase [Methanobacteriota archaeon]|jgi:NOL1/NOP2/sun family putative RNA methylase|uniref:RsmB/NOP family class I SAM-dependent RNA methyltransferase n=1 Tax=Halorutilus salinus TaxID=2487751 RepID=A0A9Q4GGV3_9EURY|nr:RsmB/NOP family class I SAM-dependent RNA methyltransferase [Halorutilus salinus]MCX2819529.1 RsmB/NOP family class I SAM-dependent RNA methyltransferase [Halorutilus salinus]
MTLERYRSIVDGYEAFVEACEKPVPRTGRVNPAKSSFGEVRDSLTAAGFGVDRFDWFADGFRIDEPDDAKVGNTVAHYLGWIAVQEEVSMLPPVVLRRSEVSLGDGLVLDICAAPGSKTTQVAAHSAGVVANDDNVGRIAALRNNTDRLGLTNVAVTSYDGRRFPGGVDFDAALVDVPCTSEGTVRKNPEYSEAGAVSDDERASVSGVQKGILTRALKLVRDGGRVVYSTCTFAPEENEAVVDHAVRNDDARVVPFDVGLGSSPGVTEWQGETYADPVRDTRRFYPHQNDTGGFYVALLEPTTDTVSP